MTDLDLCYTPAVELARRIRDREISPLEIVRNSLERIDAVNPILNCFCFTFPDEAMAKAKAAEQAVMRGESLGTLHGVPIAIKDFTPTKGKTTTMGSKIYADWVPQEDAQIVKDLTGAGAIMVGKTNTPEFAHAGFVTVLCGGSRAIRGIRNAHPVARPVVPAPRWRRAVCRWPKGRIWEGRCVSRPRFAARWVSNPVLAVSR